MYGGHLQGQHQADLRTRLNDTMKARGLTLLSAGMICAGRAQKVWTRKLAYQVLREVNSPDEAWI